MPPSGSDIERTQVRIPKGAVCRPIHRDWMRLEYPARRCKDVDHGPRSGLAPAGAGDDVPLCVQTHAVDTPLYPVGVLAKGMQRGIGPERVIVSQRVGPEFPYAVIIALGDIQGELILREQDAVGRGGVKGHTLQRPVPAWLWIQPQDRGMVQLPFLSGPTTPKGVGEPDTSFA